VASTKSLYIAQESIKALFARHEVVFYWTFTAPSEGLPDKTEAERRFKPFKDLIARRGGDLLHFWELQERGAWHVHCLTNKYLDVKWLRPWMVARGWGPIMKVIRVESKRVWVDGQGWTRDERSEAKLIGYLTKYLTKCFREGRFYKKVFGGNARSKIGTTLFRWVPWEKPGAYLYFWGAQLFRELYHKLPRFTDIEYCIRLGYEVCNWEDRDPIFYECR
jgi:hypothetical protein